MGHAKGFGSSRAFWAGQCRAGLLKPALGPFSPQPTARGVVVSPVEQLNLAASVICSGYCCSWCSSFHLLELLSSHCKVQCCLVNSPSKTLKKANKRGNKKGENSGLTKVSFGPVIFIFLVVISPQYTGIFDFDRGRERGRSLSCVTPCIGEHAFRFIPVKESARMLSPS